MRDSLWNQVKLVFCHRYVALFSKMVGCMGRQELQGELRRHIFNIFTKINIRKNFHLLNRFMCVSKLFFSIFFATQQNVYSAMSTQTSVYCRKTAEMYSVVLHTKNSRNIAHAHAHKVHILAIFYLFKFVASAGSFTWISSVKLFGDPLRLPISPSTSKITTDSTYTAHYNCH